MRRPGISLARRMGTSALLAVIASCVFATAALGSGGSSVKIVAPKTVQVGGPKFTITLKGNAAVKAWLYLWVQSGPCLATPAAEHAEYGGYLWTVRHSFKEPTHGWRATGAGTTFVCAYLSKKSEPKNSAHGVLARASHKIVSH
jgi:hypothetical protein